jgi:hypothetical protein
VTKYGLIAHVACICLFPVGVLGQARLAGLTPLFWLSFLALEWMFLLPSVKHGETLADARRRMWHAFLWDPFLYAGAVFVALAGVQCLNSGLELVYLPDADIWQLSEPSFARAPFAVERNAAFAHLAWFTACCVVGVALRTAVGKGAKRVLLQLLACASGLIAFCMVAFACTVSSYEHGRRRPGRGRRHLFGILDAVGGRIVCEKTNANNAIRCRCLPCPESATCRLLFLHLRC